MSQSVRFEQLEIEYATAKSNAQTMRNKAKHEPIQENLDAANAADEAKATKCREFRNYCAQRRDGLTQQLGDPASKFSAPEQASKQESLDEAIKRLSELKDDCPTVDDPPTPLPPAVKAGRILP